MEQLIEQAINKLDEELKKTPQAQVFVAYLKSKCQTDLSLTENIIKQDKTLSGLINHIQTEAKKKSTGNFAVVEDNVVFKWVENYYGKEKPVINESDVEAAAEAITKGASSTITEKPQPKKSKEKKKEEQSDSSQISLLDFI